MVPAVIRLETAGVVVAFCHFQTELVKVCQSLCSVFKEQWSFSQWVTYVERALVVDRSRMLPELFQVFDLRLEMWLKFHDTAATKWKKQKKKSGGSGFLFWIFLLLWWIFFLFLMKQTCCSTLCFVSTFLLVLFLTLLPVLVETKKPAAQMKSNLNDVSFWGFDLQFNVCVGRHVLLSWLPEMRNFTHLFTNNLIGPNVEMIKIK